ncbi:MAG TPA: methyltransferase domain-containing protein [Anaerolineae bacterium]|nr:methyltransferase domain-containing protein [Anaerolineae bacterium]
MSVDINPAYTPNVVADICEMPFKSNSVGGIICAAILEHVYDPFRAVDEMHSVLAPRGGCSSTFLDVALSCSR